MSKKQKLRFGFVLRNGPQRSWTSGSWRVWVNREDTYITATSVGQVWKASLHGDESWRIAITGEHARSNTPLIDPTIGRSMWEFEPVPFEHGRRLAFAIAPLRGSYLPRELGESDIHIEVHDSWDEITVAYVWMTEAGVEFEKEGIIGGPFALDSGRQVWVTAGVERWTQVPANDIVGALIEPQIPGRDPVNAPGFLVRGYRLG